MNAIALLENIMKNAFVKVTFYVLFSLLFVYWLIDYNFIGVFRNIAWQDFLPRGLLICFILITMQISRGWRLSCLLAKGLTPPEKTAYKVSTLHNFFAMLMPAKMGELSFLVLARKFDLRMQDSGKTLIHMRFLDLLLVVVLFLVSGQNFLDALPLSIPAPLYIIAVSAGLIVCFIIRNHIYAALRWLSMDIQTFYPVLAISIIILMCHVLGSWLAVQAFDLGFTFLQTLSIVSAGMLAFALPLSGVGNVGPYHAVWLLAAQLYDVDPETALAAGTTYHALAFITLCLQSAFVKLAFK